MTLSRRGLFGVLAAAPMAAAAALSSEPRQPLPPRTVSYGRVEPRSSYRYQLVEGSRLMKEELRRAVDGALAAYSPRLEVVEAF